MRLRKGNVFVYYGNGRGKTSLAIGMGIRQLGQGHNVMMIQFMDYDNKTEIAPLKKLEPDFRIFCFEKTRDFVDETSECVRKEIVNEINISFGFAKKILETGECDILILNGILDAMEGGYLSVEELKCALCKKASYMDVILTGKNINDEIFESADFVYAVSVEKET